MNTKPKWGVESCEEWNWIGTFEDVDVYNYTGMCPEDVSDTLFRYKSTWGAIAKSGRNWKTYSAGELFFGGAGGGASDPLHEKHITDHKEILLALHNITQ